jgi:hypothetical protein
MTRTLTIATQHGGHQWRLQRLLDIPWDLVMDKQNNKTLEMLRLRFNISISEICSFSLDAEGRLFKGRLSLTQGVLVCIFLHVHLFQKVRKENPYLSRNDL